MISFGAWFIFNVQWGMYAVERSRCLSTCWSRSTHRKSLTLTLDSITSSNPNVGYSPFMSRHRRLRRSLDSTPRQCIFPPQFMAETSGLAPSTSDHQDRPFCYALNNIQATSSWRSQGSYLKTLFMITWTRSDDCVLIIQYILFVTILRLAN